MPNKKNNKSKSFRMDSTVRVPFVTSSSTVRKTASGYEFTELNLTIASFTDRIAAIAPFYEYFRVASLDLELFNDSHGSVCPIQTAGTTSGYSAVGLSLALGWIPSASADFGAVTSFEELLQFPNAKIGSAERHLKLKLSVADLYAAQPVKWFHTKSTGSIGNDLLSAGCITYGTYSAGGFGASSATSFCVIRGVVELRSPIEDSLSVMLPERVASVPSLIGSDASLTRVESKTVSAPLTGRDSYVLLRTEEPEESGTPAPTPTHSCVGSMPSRLTRLSLGRK